MPFGVEKVGYTSYIRYWKNLKHVFYLSYILESKLEHIRNEDTRKQMKVNRTIEDNIKKQLIWYGYVRRIGKERLPKEMLEWIAPEKMKRRKSPKTRILGILKTM